MLFLIFHILWHRSDCFFIPGNIMLRHNLVIIVVAAGLISCSESTDTQQITIEKTETKTPAKRINIIEKPKRKPLDLSLPIEWSTASMTGHDYSQKYMLPDLFSEQKEEEKKVIIHGDLLSDPSIPHYTDSVDGPEISVEVDIP